MLRLWEEFLFHENMLQFLALCACTILVAYLLTELIGINPGCGTRTGAKIMRPIYGYNLENVVLQGCWAEAPPTLSGGPTGGTYQFQAALFRWGLSDAEGSEHTINHMAFPLELQALHARVGPTPLTAPALVAVAYLFEITEVDNPYLDQVVLALPHVMYPGRAVDLMPFALSWLCPPFTTKYFTYDGSLTFPPCSESVRWIVRPAAIGISPRQALAFRMLLGWDGPLRANLRPVQSLFCRDVFYYADLPPEERAEATQIEED